MLELEVCPEAISLYRGIAEKHLETIGSVMEVAKVGLDEEGDEIFGIRTVKQDGTEEWYDSDTSTATLIGWKDKVDAYSILENRLLPNLGYKLLQRNLILFHQNLALIK